VLDINIIEAAKKVDEQYRIHISHPEEVPIVLHSS
jgi:hypothetical protein